MFSPACSYLFLTVDWFNRACTDFFVLPSRLPILPVCLRIDSGRLIILPIVQSSYWDWILVQWLYLLHLLASSTYTPVTAKSDYHYISGSWPSMPDSHVFFRLHSCSTYMYFSNGLRSLVLPSLMGMPRPVPDWSGLTIVCIGRTR